MKAFVRLRGTLLPSPCTLGYDSDLLVRILPLIMIDKASIDKVYAI